MKQMGHFNWVATMAMSTVLAVPTAAQTNLASAQIAQNAPKRVIIVSLEDHKLALVEDGKVKKIYPVAVGKTSTPSPVGTFTIERRVMNPTYSHDGRVVPPGPNNPVGDRWMGLSIPGYGIHGTNVPSSIGNAASHGCIRMGKADLEELFSLVEVGDTVELIGARNVETAQLFGGGAVATPTVAQQPVMMAQAHPVPATPRSPAANNTNPVATLVSLARAGLSEAAAVPVAAAM
jgi:hypothetical protein